jgi:hypothetical protein
MDYLRFSKVSVHQALIVYTVVQKRNMLFRWKHHSPITQHCQTKNGPIRYETDVRPWCISKSGRYEVGDLAHQNLPMTSTGRVSSLASANLVRRGDWLRVSSFNSQIQTPWVLPSGHYPAGISFFCTVTQSFVPAFCTTHWEPATTYLVSRSLSLSLSDLAQADRHESRWGKCQ